MRIDLWHNILWSRYKGAVFAQLDLLCRELDHSLNVLQIAKTDSDRALLSPVDHSVHTYPYELLFEDNYSNVPLGKMIWETTRRVFASRADVVLLAGYDRPEYIAQLLIAKLKGRKVGVFCDSTLYDRPQTMAKRLVKTAFFGLCDGVFCYGERSAQFIESHGVRPGKIFIRVQSTLPLAQLSRDEILARRTSVRARPPHFAYVGRLSAEKSLPFLLDAFARYLSANPEARLTLVGAGPLKAELERRSAELGVAAEVTFAGSLSGPALADAILDATALVLPSRSEPWGLVVNEALALGVPVLVSHRCGCVPELVVDGKTGYAVRHGDVADFAEKMAQVADDVRGDDALAGRCLDHIAPFNSRASALGILKGCESLFGGKSMGTDAGPRIAERTPLHRA